MIETAETLGAACARILLTADPRAKVMAARSVAREWRRGRIGWAFDGAMPDRPAAGPAPLLAPSRMPKRGRGGTAASRVALLHALAHIEYVAIDLAFDLIGRFGDGFPRAFVDDWMTVAAEEAMHFALLDRRLAQMGSRYGALPAHDGLWEAAAATAGDAMARLAVVPMVLEARGLDVTPQTIGRLEAAGDPGSARLLRRILSDEVKHVGTGVRWFRIGCDLAGLNAPQHWRSLISAHFGGLLKPPFNDSARTAAGLTPDFYHGIASAGSVEH